MTMNHFAALEITNGGIIEKVLKVQEKIIRHHPEYERFQIPANGLHLTLAVFGLKRGEEQTCIEVMNEISPELRKLAERSRHVAITGVGNFGTKVAYAAVDPTPQLEEISDLIKRSLAKENIFVDGKPFRPHLTLFKATGSAQLRDLEAAMLPYKEVDFGRQHINNIQVCRMGTLRDTGFYRSIFGMEI